MARAVSPFDYAQGDTMQNNLPRPPKIWYSMGIMPPTPVPTRTLNIRNRGIAKKLGTKGKKREQKRIGIGMALLLIMFASTYDALDILLTILGDDYGIIDILFAPATLLFAMYLWRKGVRRSSLYLLAWLIEWIPILDVFNLQTVYVLVIIASNWSQTARKRGQEAEGRWKLNMADSRPLNQTDNRLFTRGASPVTTVARRTPAPRTSMLPRAA